MNATNGNDFWNHSVAYGTGNSGVSECSPILADIDGSGKVGVLMGAEDGRLYGFNVGRLTRRRASRSHSTARCAGHRPSTTSTATG